MKLELELAETRARLEQEKRRVRMQAVVHTVVGDLTIFEGTKENWSRFLEHCATQAEQLEVLC